MKLRFRIDIACENEIYYANIYSITDNKGIPKRSASLRRLLNYTSKVIRDKNSEIKHFPIPEESLIIAPDGKGDINLIIPAHN